MNSLSLSLSIVLLLNVAFIYCDGLSLFQRQQQQLRQSRHCRHDVASSSSSSSSLSTTARRYKTIGHGTTIRPQLQLQASPSLSGGGDSQPSQAQVDNATTLPQLMKSLWALISYASKNMYRGVSF